MAEHFELTDELKSAIGQASAPWQYEVTTTSVRAFARGAGYTDPVYFDLQAAEQAGYRNLPAPPTYLGTPVFIPGHSHDIFSGPSRGNPKIDHGLKNVLDGGTEVEYFDEVCAGDTLTGILKVASLEVRESKALGKMLLVTTETSYTNERDDIVAVMSSQVIFY